MKKIKNSEITLAKNLNEYKPDLNEMKRGRNKSKEQKKYIIQYKNSLQSMKRNYYIF